MKMLFALLGVLCLTGIIKAAEVAKGVACGGDTGDTCAATLQCQNGKCRVKLGEGCTDGGDECPVTDGNDGVCQSAATCPSVCPANHVKSADDFQCLKKIDQTGCTDEKPCVTTAQCVDVSNVKTCKCSDKSVANSDMDKCLMFSGETCADTSDCITNAECPTSGSKNCKCKTNYLASYNDGECKLAYDADCTNAQQGCGRNAECKSNKCACQTGYEGGSATELCSIKDGKDCMENEDCKKGQTCENKVSGKGTCSGAAAVMASMLLLLAAFVGTRWI